MVGECLDVLSGGLGGGGAQLLQVVVEQDAAVLDQAVGEEQRGPAGGQGVAAILEA